MTALPAAVCALPAAELLEGAREAVAHQLLVTHPDGTYAFRHALVGEAIYEDLLPGERTALHAALAANLERDPALIGDVPLSNVPTQLACYWRVCTRSSLATCAMATSTTRATTRSGWRSSCCPRTRGSSERAARPELEEPDAARALPRGGCGGGGGAPARQAGAVNTKGISAEPAAEPAPQPAAPLGLTPSEHEVLLLRQRRVAHRLGLTGR